MLPSVRESLFFFVVFPCSLDDGSNPLVALFSLFQAVDAAISAVVAMDKEVSCAPVVDLASMAKPLMVGLLEIDQL